MEKTTEHCRLELESRNSNHETSELNSTDKLLFSDSDSDAAGPSKNVKRKSDKIQKLIDTDSDSENVTTTNIVHPAHEEVVEVLNAEELNNKNTETGKIKRLSKYKLIDSSSESETEFSNTLSNSLNKNDNTKNSSSEKQAKKVRKSAIIDSDSESENGYSKVDDNVRIDNVTKIVDEKLSKITNKGFEINAKKNLNPKLIDSDSESENDSFKRSKFSGIHFSDESTDKDSAAELQNLRKKKKIKRKFNKKTDTDIEARHESSSDEDDNINKVS